MPAEPDWSKNAFNANTLCTWFYAFAIINGVGAGIGILFALFYLFGFKNPNAFVFMGIIIPSIIYFFHFWFAYAICQRTVGASSN